MIEALEGCEPVAPVFAYAPCLRIASPHHPWPMCSGWNRLVLETYDLASLVESLKQSGVHFRSEIVAGPGGKQILVDDPSGNPIELFQPDGR